ncbi:hypothetical protein [Spiroplasma endosymbiont of Nebria brevicollis]|uniref:hypothetical protein n=1 Tax=Spiroplasma endosymbiont of Nebria brevicollis TaxID=3066284 RepID=UPI00313BF13E
MPIRNEEYWDELQSFLANFEDFKSVIQNVITSNEKKIEEVETKIKKETLEFIEKAKSIENDINTLVYNKQLGYIKYEHKGIWSTTIIDEKTEVDKQKQKDTRLFKETSEILDNFAKLKDITKDTIDAKYNNVVEEYVKSIIDINSQVALEHKKNTRIRNGNFLNGLNTINEGVKTRKETLQKDVDDFINVSEKTVAEIQKYILDKTEVFIDWLKTEDLEQKITAIDNGNLLKYKVVVDGSNVSVQKQKDQKNYQTLKKFYEDLVKGTEQLKFDYEEDLNNSMHDISDKSPKEISKINVQSFLNKSIISAVQKNKIMNKLRSELENKKEDTLDKNIRPYFEKIENYIAKPYNEHLKKYHYLTNTIDSEFQKEYELLKSLPDNYTKLKEINDKYKRNRKEAFDNFQEEISKSLPNIDFLLNPNNELEVYKQAMLLNKDITSEERQKFLATINKLTEIKLKIKSDQKEDSAIQNRETPIYDAIDEVEFIRRKTILKNIYDSPIKIDNDGTAYDDNGDVIDEEIIKSLVYLEENLKLDNERTKLDSSIDEWFENINQIKSAKAKIKNWNTYKIITARNQNFSPFNEEKFKPIGKERVEDLKIFKSPLSNRRAQQWMVNGVRKQAFRDLLLITKTEKYRFSKTIDELETSQSKSRLWKFFNSLKTGFKWFGKITGISKRSKLLAPFLLIVSPFTTLPFAAIKSTYHQIRQSSKPNIYLERDTKRIKELKEQLDEKCQKIKIKYAKKMAKPDSKRSFFNVGKPDSQYLEAAKREITVAKAEFKVAVAKITVHYEKWAKKQDTIYGENGRANKKIEAVEMFFSELEDAQTPSDAYEKLNDVTTLNQAVSKRIGEIDYPKEDLPKNMKNLINDSGIITDENRNKLINTDWSVHLS